MRDYYALLQKSTASTMQTILHMPVSAQHVEIPAAGYAARSAAPLEFHAQAWDWAAQLNENAALFQLFGAPYVAGVGANNGHLLFTFTGAFYTAALQEILKELPPAHVPVPYSGEDAALQRIAYAARRMWMLRRKAQGTPCCPAVEEVQRALLLAMAISGGGITPRALVLRMQAAAEALLGMAHGAKPKERMALSVSSAHVGDAAARLLAYGMEKLMRGA